MISRNIRKFENIDLVKVMMHNISKGAIQWQIPAFLSDGIVMFAISLTICEKFTKIMKFQKF